METFCFARDYQLDNGPKEKNFCSTILMEISGFESSIIFDIIYYRRNALPIVIVIRSVRRFARPSTFMLDLRNRSGKRKERLIGVSVVSTGSICLSVEKLIILILRTRKG